MSGNDNAGRIPKLAFLVSCLTIFALCLFSAVGRFYVRIRVQKQLSIDDGFLIFGIICLITAVGLMFTFIDTLYMIEALVFGSPNLELTPDWLERVFYYQKVSAACYILTWCSICSVKFSFLFLFKTLINRLRYLVIYWWVITVFAVAVTGYGITVYIFVCPYFGDMKAVSCGTGPGIWWLVKISVSAMVLDVVSDLLILFIPIRIIWQLRIRWTQKAALSFSLCLTIVMIAMTLIRASGIHQGDSVDATWEVYWQFMAAEIGIIMTALTAFRQFFVARSNERNQHPPGIWQQWSSKGKHFFRRIWAPSTWRNKNISQSSSEQSNEHNMELPAVPRGTMTGIRTFINGQGRTKMGSSRIMESHVDERNDDRWPLSSRV